ncbi:MAG: Fe-S cluster assembly protein HesB [Actinomycetota bacterium]
MTKRDRTTNHPEHVVVALRGPSGEPVDLWRTLVSHGFHELAPAALDEEAHTLSLTMRMPRGKPRRVAIGQGPRRTAVVTMAGSSPSAATRASIGEQVARVLHLDHDLAPFYAIAAGDPDLAWATTGAGRMLRSPTVWEDVIKTLCTTNCSWGLTVTMVRALVTSLGEQPLGTNDPLHAAFPTPAAMAAFDERFYREVVRSGYRAPSFVRLSSIVAEGELDLEALGAASRDELPDAEVESRLLALPGIGPYAAAHVMMTLGRNSKLILDSWTRPTFARLAHARRQPTDVAIQRRFRRYGPDAGLAFWLYVTRDWVA